MNWLQHAQHERSTNSTAEQKQTCGQEHEVRKTAKAKEQLRVKEERRKKEEREREELEADLERARLLADREKEEEEKEKEREAEARTIAFHHRQLADAVCDFRRARCVCCTCSLCLRRHAHMCHSHQ